MPIFGFVVVVEHIHMQIITDVNPILCIRIADILQKNAQREESNDNTTKVD